MAFDTSTRKGLEKFVGKARCLLTEEFIEQLQSLYGISASGEIAPIERLGHLGAEGRELAGTLRQRIAYLISSHADSRDATEAAVARLTREQAFTIVNRLAAIRMAETRGLIVESVGQQYQSKGFKVFESVAGSAIGETFDRYRCYLFCLFDELAIDLGVLFDRKSPQAMLFPREPALLALLDLLDAPDLQPLWAEDETIGWIYQYYNDDAERKKMREESAAPRNSRELAVRNQFFTPRYVVEFLTDNTLGRIWYEMTQGQTSLKDSCRYLVRRSNEIFLKAGESLPEKAASGDTESVADLSQEELFEQPVHIPYRPLKDPREIRLLDPACGSMHFGLYAFDLFTVIYDEAWEIAHSTVAAAKSADTFTPFVAFAQSFTDKAAFLLEAPRFIIEHNLHGIDIDPRAAQIAGLSLWLRAQRAWHQASIKPVDRPRITRSNIVCAEPMPGDSELLREFVEQQFPPGEQPAFRFLLAKIFDRMTLAGEAGSLVRIEEEIRCSIAEAKKIWEQEPHHEQKTLFASFAEKTEGVQKRIDLSGITTEEFWERAEERIYDALAAYAEQAEEGDGFKRRLFVDDAAQGFAFIDLCRKRYDVAVMNPPFGDASSRIAELLGESYPFWNANLLCAFVGRCLELLKPCGFLGCIYDRTANVKTTYESFRHACLLSEGSLALLADLGWGVLDANVETSSQIVAKRSMREAICFDLRAAPVADKGQLLLSRIAGENGGANAVLLVNAFLSFPNSAIAYDMPSPVRRAFAEFPSLQDSSAFAVVGHQLKSDWHMYCWWELPNAGLAAGGIYKRLYNGGTFCRYYMPLVEAGLWGSDGSLVRDHKSVYLRNASYHFRAAIGYGKRGDCVDAHALPSGFLFTNEGQAVVPDSLATIFFFLGLLNSKLFSAIINLYCGQHKQSGYVNVFPIPPDIDPALRDRISVLSRECVMLKLRADVANELSPQFAGVPQLTAVNVDALLAAVERNSSQIEGLLYDAYLVGEGEKEQVLANLPPWPADTVSFFGAEPTVQSEEADAAASRISYAIGVVFGRWDIRYATGERSAPELPDPFAPLPVCPPGLLQGEDGLPLAPEAGRRLRDDGYYPLDIAWDGILVDDPEHPLDLERRVHSTLAVIWGDRVDAIEQEACTLLGVPMIRDWFRRPAGFFADHLKRYSKSRRQAPIYWPLSTRSGDYTLWIYYHRLNDQTLHRCLADFLDPKIVKVENELASVAGRPEGKAAELRDFVSELKDLRDEIERVITLPWRPNLNDGVLITASPLWKLFRLSKWSKDLKACWEKLEQGDYDWAHLAYTIWPARVEKACESDRSIAIARGLEHLCKVELPKPKKPRGKKAKS